MLSSNARIQFNAASPTRTRLSPFLTRAAPSRLKVQQTSSRYILSLSCAPPLPSFTRAPPAATRPPPACRVEQSMLVHSRRPRPGTPLAANQPARPIHKRVVSGDHKGLRLLRLGHPSPRARELACSTRLARADTHAPFAQINTALIRRDKNGVSDSLGSSCADEVRRRLPPCRHRWKRLPLG